MQKQLFQTLYIAGSVLVLLGACSQFFNLFFSPYIFSIGVAILIFIHIKLTIEGRKGDLRQERLSRNGLLASLLLGVAAYFMFTHSNIWVLGVLIYALSTFFTSYRGK